MTVKNVMLTDKTGQWFVRDMTLWNTPTYYEIKDKDEAPKYLGYIALNPKFCDGNSFKDAQVFASEDEAFAFAEKHGLAGDEKDRPKTLHIIYINADGHLTWDKPL